MVGILAAEPIGMAFFAPATLVRTMEAPGFEAAVRGRPASKLCAGAPLGADQKRQILGTWPGPLFDLYGQTETGTLTILSAHAAPADKLGSVGTLLPTASVKILDEEGRVLPPDAEGEIAGHTTTLMSGYHGRAEAVAAATWHDESGRRFIRTGDVGRLDADGYLWLCDRKKDLIISGGYNIYPADIERVLQGHPAVLEVAVVGFPSVRWGETPVAFVTLRDGTEAERGQPTRVGECPRGPDSACGPGPAARGAAQRDDGQDPEARAPQRVRRFDRLVAVTAGDSRQATGYRQHLRIVFVRDSSPLPLDDERKSDHPGE